MKTPITAGHFAAHHLPWEAGRDIKLSDNYRTNRNSEANRGYYGERINIYDNEALLMSASDWNFEITGQFKVRS